MSDSLWDEEEDEQDDDVVDVDGEVTETETKTEDQLPTADDTNSVVKPVEDIDAVVEAYDKFEEVKDKLLSNADLTKIGDGVHVNKSGWRKIATAFNLSTQSLEKIKTVEDGVVRYEVKARAVAPNGKTSEATGMCGSNESNFMEAGAPDEGEPADHEDYFKIDGKWRRLKDPKAVDEHSIMATAETRAINRAISDLVGGGEVSAEELAAKKKGEILE